MEITINAWPTSYGPDLNGKFYPAVGTPLGVHYWPNITFDNENDAYQHAAETFAKDVYQPANAIARGWNMVRA